MLALILLHISIYEMRRKERFIISSNKSILSLNVFAKCYLTTILIFTFAKVLMLFGSFCERMFHSVSKHNSSTSFE